MRRSRALAWILLAALACSSPEERAEAAREQALRAIARGDRGAALQALGRLRERPPETPGDVEALATLLVNAGEAPEAVWVLEEGVARFDAASLRLALSTALLLVSDAARARAVADAIPADAPERGRALMLRGQAELKLGRFDAALASFHAAERDFPEQRGVRLPRIAALVQERRFEEAHAAIAAASGAAGDDEERASLRRLEASLFALEARDGDALAALAGIRELLLASPDDPALWTAMVQLSFAQRRHEEARALVVTALEQDPDRLALYALLAAIDAARGERAAAEDALRAWIARAPSSTATAALARFHAADGDADAALAAVDERVAEAGPDPQLLGVRAEVLLAAGRLAPAEAVLDAFADAAVDPRPVELLRARLQLERGDAEGARLRLERLVPELDDGDSQFWLGRALEETGDPVGAERRYAIAAMRDTADPAGPLAAYRLARARGAWPVAAAYAQHALQRAPGRVEAWTAMLAALIELGDGEGAEALALRGLRRFPDEPLLHALHGAALRTRGRSEEALAAIERGRALDPDAPELLTERALALAVGGDTGRGIEELETALAAAPDDLALLHARAMLLFHAGRADEGDAVVERALALAPDDLRPLRRRLAYRAASGRHAAARDDAERYLARHPSDADVWFTLGVAREGSGDREAAVAAYRRAAELDPTGHAPLNNLAHLLGRAGRLDAALEAAQQAYRRADSDPHVLDTLGWLYLQSGRVERSISLLEQARDLAPDLAAAALHLAHAYREAGRDGEARALLVAMRPETPELRREVAEALAALR